MVYISFYHFSRENCLVYIIFLQFSREILSFCANYVNFLCKRTGRGRWSMPAIAYPHPHMRFFSECFGILASPHFSRKLHPPLYAPASCIFHLFLAISAKLNPSQQFYRNPLLFSAPLKILMLLLSKKRERTEQKFSHSL